MSLIIAPFKWLQRAFRRAEPLGGSDDHHRGRVADTGCLRIRPVDGPPVVVAVTLCAEGFLPGEVIVHGTAGRAELEYTTDRLRLPGEDYQDLPGRSDLLINLLQQSDELIAPLALTAPFTAVIEQLASAPTPWPVDPARVSERDAGPARKVVIQGIDAVVRASAGRLALFSELSGLDGIEPPQVKGADL